MKSCMRRNKSGYKGKNLYLYEESTEFCAGDMLVTVVDVICRILGILQ